MGFSASRLGSAKLLLRDKVLEQGSQLSGSIQLTLKKPVTPRGISVLLQSREQTNWVEQREMYDPISRKYRRVDVDMGTSDVQTVVPRQQIHGNFGGIQYDPGTHSFPFVIDLPTSMKQIMSINSGEATAGYGYELEVGLESDFGEHNSILPLPGPRGIDRLLDNSEAGESRFSQSFGHMVTFKPLLRQNGVVKVSANFDPSSLIPGEPFQVILDLDNTRNPYNLVTAYLTLVRNVEFKGTSSAVYRNMEILQVKELDCLPIKAGTFVQQYTCSFGVKTDLPPSFHGNIIKTQYLLQLHLDSQYKLGRVQTIVLSEVTILPRQEREEKGSEEVALKKKRNEDGWGKWVYRIDWKDAALRIGLSAVIKGIELLLKRK